MARNACHSFRKKPCVEWKNIEQLPHENVLAKTTTYFHTPDIESNKQRGFDEQYAYKFFVVTLRDPLSRAVSAFLFDHPKSIKVEHENSYKYCNWTMLLGCPFRKRYPPEISKFYDPCFPTLDAYAKHLGPNATNDYDGKDWHDHLGKDGAKNDCPKLAQATMNHAVKGLMEHQYYDLRRIFHPLTNLTERPLLVIRTEFLWDDFNSTLEWLGEDEEVEPMPSRRASNSDPVSKTLSNEGRQNLCLALKIFWD